VTRIIHTADWHLGARLIDCDRHDEHRAFLDWFLIQLAELRPDLVIVAGDIFDGATPPQEALKLYYSFLGRLAAGTGALSQPSPLDGMDATKTRCRTLILGGNHDSPATLHAPRDVLRALDVRVIASPPDDPADGLLEFADAVVCAVPYLRERDVRTAAPGQSADEVAAAIRTGVGRYYRQVHDLARTKAAGRLLVATGHLTVVGSDKSPGERPIHIGNLGAVEVACFAGFAYTALGHIHRPQRINGDDRVRYAGSPIPLSFAEVDLAKEIRVIDIAAGQLAQRAISIPVFRPLKRISATAATLATELARHQGAPGDSLLPWVELTVTDGRSHPDLDRQVHEAAADLRLRVLKVLAPASLSDSATTGNTAPPPSLNDLRPEDVFTERLRREQIDPDSTDGQTLALTFAELLSGMQDMDPAEKTQEVDT